MVSNTASRQSIHKQDESSQPKTGKARHRKIGMRAAIKTAIKACAERDNATGSDPATLAFANTIKGAVEEEVWRTVSSGGGSDNDARKALSAICMQRRPNDVLEIIRGSVHGNTRVRLCDIAIASYNISKGEAVLNKNTTTASASYHQIDTAGLEQSLEEVVRKHDLDSKAHRIAFAHAVESEVSKWISEQCDIARGTDGELQWSLNIDSLPDSIKAIAVHRALSQAMIERDAHEIPKIIAAAYPAHELEIAIRSEKARAKLIGDITKKSCVDEKAAAATKLAQVLQWTTFGATSGKSVKLASNYDGDYPVTISNYRKPKTGIVNTADDIVDAFRVFEDDCGDKGFVSTCWDIRQIELERELDDSRWTKTELPTRHQVRGTLYHSKIIFHATEAVARDLSEWITTHATIPLAVVTFENREKQ